MIHVVHFIDKMTRKSKIMEGVFVRSLVGKW